MIMETGIQIALAALAGYLIGSFPTAYAVSKTFFGFDIRSKGSGNMGSTNAFRVLGAKWGVVVQIVDIAKGVLPVLLIAPLISGIFGAAENASLLSSLITLQFAAGLAAVLGHIWPLYLKFKGGKGVNTAVGMLVAVAPVDVAIALGVFVLAVILSGYISLGSITGAIAAPSSMFVRYNFIGVEITGYYLLIYFMIGLAALLIYAHRSNIVRLLKGKENKFEKLQVIKCESRQTQ